MKQRKKRLLKDHRIIENRMMHLLINQIECLNSFYDLHHTPAETRELLNPIYKAFQELIQIRLRGNKMLKSL